MSVQTSKKIHAIVPAGGAGTRLWPLSRRSHPKFLLDLTGSGKSLLQETVERLWPLSETVTVVTGAAHVGEVKEQLEGLGVRVLVEPTPRDSMAAIGYATYVIREEYGAEAVVGSFAADHVIENIQAFERAVNKAVGGASAGYLTTIGIAPTEPSTAFGYIEPSADEVAPGVMKVSRFVEKPDAQTASEYVTQGYLWNAGMFIAQAGTITAALVHLLPQMDSTLSLIAADGMQQELWDSLQRIAIDYALAEPLAAKGHVAVVRADNDLGWSDVGDFAAVARLGGAGEPALRIGAEGSVHLSGDGVPPRFIAVVGVPGVVIAETADSMLVTDLNHAQSVKEVTDWLRLNREDLL